MGRCSIPQFLYPGPRGETIRIGNGTAVALAIRRYQPLVPFESWCRRRTGGKTHPRSAYIRASSGQDASFWQGHLPKQDLFGKLICQKETLSATPGSNRTSINFSRVVEDPDGGHSFRVGSIGLKTGFSNAPEFDEGDHPIGWQRGNSVALDKHLSHGCSPPAPKRKGNERRDDIPNITQKCAV